MWECPPYFKMELLSQQGTLDIMEWKAAQTDTNKLALGILIYWLLHASAVLTSIPNGMYLE